MTISQAGQLNTTALVVPDLYIQIVPPQTQYLNGVPTNVAAIVGTAPWGPTNSPTTVGNPAQYSGIFGQVQNRKYDIGTILALAALQGASNFKVVRVTDGTDTAAQVAVASNCITFAGKWTGSLGNSIVVTLSSGSAVGSYRVVVSAPGIVPEAFDNIGQGLSGNAVWVAIANAINSGSSLLRGPSRLITATAGAGTTPPTLTQYSLAGGTDGASGVNGASLLGQDTVPRTGMYALRGSGASVAALADCDDSTTWSTQVAFGLSEQIYMIATDPAGEFNSIASAVSNKANAGIDSYAMKLCLGDWVYWQDTYNNIMRLVSPQGPLLGILANLAPNQSSLNKAINGIAGTQKSFANQIYSEADLQQLALAGIDVITNPSPGGTYFSARIGHNTSSNPLVNGDNYTRMTNYIASTINAGMGIFIGQLDNPTVQGEARDTLSAYFQTLQDQGLIGSANGGAAYSVEIDAKNNPQSRTALGYLQADVKVVYTPIVEKFLINVEGGTSVTITRQSVSLT